MRRLIMVAALAVAGFAALPAGPAAAHPLGNFSVNRSATLSVHPDRIDAFAVADLAELPTLQDTPASCDEVAAALSVTVGGENLRWAIRDTSLTYAAGAGGLKTSRLECRLSASAKMTDQTRVDIAYSFRDDRIGWRELVATGSGVRLEDSPLPAKSPTNELRSYPSDPLASPADVRSASFTAAPASGTAPAAQTAGTSIDRRSGLLAGFGQELDNLVGGTRLTPLVGLLAVLLSLLLGAAHAALPGHGKTVMAAYLAGSEGRPRDAVLVGATVTFTHTAGVIALGLFLTAVSGVAGETVLGWLGLTSGLLVATVGIGALVSSLLRRTPTRYAPPHHTHDTTPTRDGAHVERFAHDHAHVEPSVRGHADVESLGHGRAHVESLAHDRAHAELATHDHAYAGPPVRTQAGPPTHEQAHAEPRAREHAPSAEPTGQLAVGPGRSQEGGDVGTLVRWRDAVSGRELAHLVAAREEMTAVRGNGLRGDVRAAHSHSHGGVSERDAVAAHDHAPGVVPLQDRSPGTVIEHDEAHARGDGDGDGHAHDHVLDQAHDYGHGDDHGHGHSDGHGHGDGYGYGHGHGPGKWGLAGLGVAGGLVPSPSALVVLLGAAALGRTVFGVLLVFAYGVGMAATLTAAGLLLVRLRHRIDRRWGFAARWRAVAPSVTAALIIVVGVGLAGRALTSVS
uniref:hypothetical protein n=1 Tax=Paractinoplanes polyasparticus TaxID=2856853 RepID=UPI001C864A54|nr:hypothetical protein [Actinoplanes polyasparticus]